MLYLHIVSRENIKIMSLNFSVLPFYDSLEEQNSKKSYAYGDVYPLYMPKGVILPFQIFNINIAVYSASHSWWLVDANTTQETDITTAMNNYISTVAISSTKENIIFFNENTLILPSIPIGRYYLRLDLNYGSLYSDIITFVDNNDNYIFLEWHNIKNLDCEVGTIVYELQDDYFKNRLYLATELGKPDYVLTEEGEERNGYFFPIKQISEKTYKFNFLSCEYLLDVLRLIHLADYIKIIDIHGKIYSANEFKIEYEWQEQGNLAAAIATFQTEAVIKKIAATIDIVEPDYINLDMFHAVVPAASAKSVAFEYPYNVNIDNLNFVGVVDQNAHIEAWRDADDHYYIINPTNIEMHMTTCSGFFKDYTALQELQFNNVLNTEQVKIFFEAFRNTTSLNSLDLTSLNTSNVTSLNYICYNSAITSFNINSIEKATTANFAFYNCSRLIALDFNGKSTLITDFSDTFRNCFVITSIYMPTCEEAITMYETFMNCIRLTTVNFTNFSLAKVSTMRDTFYHCDDLINLININQSITSLTNLYRTFGYCINLLTLDLSNWNVSNVTTFYCTFFHCENLTSLNIASWAPPITSTLRAMFQGMFNITLLDLRNFGEMRASGNGTFFSCSKLVTIIANTWNLTDKYSTFGGCARIVGGNGFTYHFTDDSGIYARVDNEDNLPGYFTAPS